MGDRWAKLDFADHWDKGRPVECKIDIASEVTYYPIESKLSAKLDALAKERGVSAETLINLWLQEKWQNEVRVRKL